MAAKDPLKTRQDVFSRCKLLCMLRSISRQTQAIIPTCVWHDGGTMDANVFKDNRQLLVHRPFQARQCSPCQHQIASCWEQHPAIDHVTCTTQHSTLKLIAITIPTINHVTCTTQHSTLKLITITILAIDHVTGTAQSNFNYRVTPQKYWHPQKLITSTCFQRITLYLMHSIFSLCMMIPQTSSL